MKSIQMPLSVIFILGCLFLSEEIFAAANRLASSQVPRKLIATQSFRNRVPLSCTDPEILKPYIQDYCDSHIPSLDPDTDLNPFYNYECKLKGKLKEGSKTYTVNAMLTVTVPGKVHFLPYQNYSSSSYGLPNQNYRYGSYGNSMRYGLSSYSQSYTNQNSGYVVYKEDDYTYQEPYHYDQTDFYCNLDILVTFTGIDPLNKKKLKDPRFFRRYSTSKDSQHLLEEAALSDSDSTASLWQNLERSVQQNDWSYLANNTGEQTSIRCGGAKRNVNVPGGLLKYLECRVTRDGTSYEIWGPWPYETKFESSWR